MSDKVECCVCNPCMREKDARIAELEALVNAQAQAMAMALAMAMVLAEAMAATTGDTPEMWLDWADDKAKEVEV